MIIKRKGICRLCGSQAVYVENTDNGLFAFGHICKNTGQKFTEVTTDPRTIIQNVKQMYVSASEVNLIKDMYKKRLKIDDVKSNQLEIVQLIEDDIF